MKLVIVESPAKAKTIQQYLGKGYTVMSSKGHIVDLPKSGVAVDVDNDFKPDYTVTKPSVLKELKSGYSKADELVLAVDPDREGEAIGWHIARELGAIDSLGNHLPKGKPVSRIVFTEITKEAVQEAAANPRDIDINLVNAQQARRVLDRLVGYKLSPLLWKKIRYGLSAGRVQSVAVKLVVDREKLRRAFKAEEYWSVDVFLEPKQGGEVKITYKMQETEVEEDEVQATGSNGIQFSLQKFQGKKLELTNKEQIEKVVSALEEAKYAVADLESKQVQKNPNSPYSTSLLQQDASNKLGYPAWKTMQIAQKLYEAGIITYMRTDSLNISQRAVAEIMGYVGKTYGNEYVPDKPNFFAQKNKVAQEAHEAIRPTHISHTPQKLGLDGDSYKLYDLIWRRAVASQMSPAKFLQQKLIVKTDNQYELHANGRLVIFPGYLKVYVDTVSEQQLPELEINSKLYGEEILAAQHFTHPPARFSEATLVKELEALGIGRPSTYAPIIQTIQQRGYVEKLGRYFKPSDIGFVVTDLLAKHFQNIVDTGFTAEMEDKLDEIANGKLDWVKMLHSFYGPFANALQIKEKEIAREDFTVLGESEEKCPDCGAKMNIKLGKFGKFISCSRFPDCKGMLPYIPTAEEAAQAGESQTAITKIDLDDYLPAPKTEDGKDYMMKTGRFGQFWAHPEYPKVKDAKPLELKPEKMEEKYGEVPLTDDKRPYLLKKGRFGMFWAHPDYPKVKDIIPVKKGNKGGARFGRKGSAKKGAADKAVKSTKSTMSGAKPAKTTATKKPIVAKAVKTAKVSVGKVAKTPKATAAISKPAKATVKPAVKKAAKKK